MTPVHSDPWLTIYGGDCRAVMAEMPAESVHCVVTSPPYWGLRDYGTAEWTGGDQDCDHPTPPRQPRNARPLGAFHGGSDEGNASREPDTRRICGKCGASRVDSQLGLEPTPEAYVANMVAVFREVRRVLRDDGTVWLNLGDSYAGGGQTGRNDGGRPEKGRGWAEYDIQRTKIERRDGLKPKDLVGIPWRVAFALQQPYYTGRIAAERDRVWMAAMLDAEGTICGFRHERPNANVRTGMLVFITNSDTRVLDEADRIWPGARYIDHNRAGDDMGHGIIANRDSWRWQIQKADERSAFVRELYPYLISKRQQAAVAWNLLEFTKAALRMGRGGETPEVKAKRDVLVGILSDLNHARPVVIPSWVKEPPGMTEPGWYLRSDIVWSKSNPMPESVTDRPTKSHEYLFLLSKQPRYYFDADAVREAASQTPGAQAWRRIFDPTKQGKEATMKAEGIKGGNDGQRDPNATARNIRSVWTIATQPYPGAHFATFPPKLVEPCIKAGTSERGVCPECGAPWVRVVERTPALVKAPASSYGHGAGRNDGGRSQLVGAGTSTIDWRSSCAHDAAPVPATCMDIFGGSGTVGMVAQSLSRRAVLIDLNPDYLRQQLERNRDMPLGLAG